MIRRHISYFKYILRHKWFVLIASFKIGSSIWLALIHDLSKFFPSEWIPYARTFYTNDGKKHYSNNEEFSYAWNNHQKRNKHHWQYWLLYKDDGRAMPLKIPSKYLSEMIADWMGAGRAITGEWEIKEWYNKNKDSMLIHKDCEPEISKTIKELDL